MHKRLPHEVFNELNQFAAKKPHLLDHVMSFGMEILRKPSAQAQRSLIAKMRQSMQHHLSALPHQTTTHIKAVNVTPANLNALHDARLAVPKTMHAPTVPGEAVRNPVIMFCPGRSNN